MSRSTSRRSTAAVPGALLVGAAGCGGGASWASPVDQHADFAEFDLTEGSEPPPGESSASDDNSDCGTPGAS
jgi:hypothetical protein